MISYRCDGLCAGSSSAAGHPTRAEAWDHARRAGWVRVTAVVDGTGHVGTLHYCRADAVRAGAASLRPAESSGGRAGTSAEESRVHQ